MRRAAMLLLVPALLFQVPSATALELGVKGAYWFARISGEFGLDAGGIQGTRVDLTDDLGVDQEYAPFGEVWLWVGGHHLILSGTRFDYAGEETLSRSVIFGGQTFTVGGRAKTSLEYSMLDLAYQYDVIDLENVVGGFSLGPILQVKYLDGEVKMSGEGGAGGAAGQVAASEEFRIPLPMVGVGGHVGLLADWVDVRVRAAGIAYRGDSIVDLQGEVALTPFPLLEVVGGYRHFAIDVEEQGVLLDYRQSGPYAGIAGVF